MGSAFFSPSNFGDKLAIKSRDRLRKNECDNGEQNAIDGFVIVDEFRCFCNNQTRLARQTRCKRSRRQEFVNTHCLYPGRISPHR